MGGSGCRIKGITRFSGRMEGGSVVANRVERGDYTKLTVNKGYH